MYFSSADLLDLMLTLHQTSGHTIQCSITACRFPEDSCFVVLSIHMSLTLSFMAGCLILDHHRASPIVITAAAALAARYTK